MIYFLHFVYQVLSELLDGHLKALEPLILLIMCVLDFKSGNQVNKLLLVWNGVHPPIVNDKCQLRDLLVRLLVLLVVGKGLAHESNKHVQEVNCHDKGG